jgi:hypothetical protein
MNQSRILIQEVPPYYKRPATVSVPESENPYAYIKKSEMPFKKYEPNYPIEIIQNTKFEVLDKNCDIVEECDFSEQAINLAKVLTENTGETFSVEKVTKEIIYRTESK